MQDTKTRTDADHLSRRALLRAGAGTAAAAGLAAAGGTAAAQSEPDYGGWLSDVGNYDGTVDRTGQSEVTITVGAEGNGGNFAFGPAAVRVDPGTTVVWEWNGQGGQHNVVAEEGGNFESELTAESGFTFEQTFDSEGMVKYYCTPHRALGMKGAIVVGGAGGAGGGESGGGEGAGDGATAPASITSSPLLLAVSSALSLAFVAVIGVVLYVLWRSEQYSPGYQPSTTEPAGAAGGRAINATEAPVESTTRELGHDDFDPVGTAGLIIVYFVILSVMWVFMYFVEFLGGGPTVVG